jgi:pSer/pThr/pTyr-binding forkhead associated (FHA) protein
MEAMTMISKKTPKIKRPVDKKVYSLICSLKKTPIILDKKKKFTIGRNSKNNLVIKQGTISEVHASIKWDKSSFKIKDEKSTNGTFVNNKRINGITILKNGDKIKIAKIVISYKVNVVREKKEVKKPVKKAVKKVVAKKKMAKRK